MFNKRVALYTSGMRNTNNKLYVGVESTGMATVGASLFYYASDSNTQPKVGEIYKVSFGKKQVLGIVRKVTTQKPLGNYRIKELGKKLELPLALPNYFLELADWLASYYVSSSKAVWSCLLPSGIGASSKLKKTKPVTKKTNSINPLNSDQKKALKVINKWGNTLLHGVTGSGKTEVYLHAISEMVENKKSTIVLVPEIILTTQLETRLQNHFKEVVVMHSGLSTARRKQLWLECLERSQYKPLIVLGPRSVLFTPLHNLGLIIVDEEHEPSYKQDAAPRYEAQSVAAKIASITKAKLVLGSATPSMRSFELARVGRIGYAQLKTRHQSSMPNIKIVDMKQQKDKIISTELYESINNNLKAKLQTLLFLNRRGSAQALICNNCGKTSKCPNCNISLSFHADIGKLKCHYCNFQTNPLAQCQYCKGSDLRFLGDGTKKLEAEVHTNWPNARVARIDKDQSDYQYLHETYKLLKAGKVDILIGTQMISRGLDIDNLSLVGVIDADISLNIPDYTASERTFQLIMQTAGRAGRRRDVGDVIVQTKLPKSPIIVSASKHNYDEFYDSESKYRAKYIYPPFCYLLKLQYAHKISAQALLHANELIQSINKPQGVALLGPTIHQRRIANKKYVSQILLKSRSRSKLVEVARELPTGWIIDIDPISLI